MNQVVLRWSLLIILLLGFALLVITGTGAYHKNQSHKVEPVELTVVADSVAPLEELTEPLEPLMTVVYWQTVTDVNSDDWRIGERERRWRKHLAPHRIKLKLINDLSSLAEVNSKTLIVADAEKLSRSQLSEIYSLLRQGYRIIVTGWIAKDASRNRREMQQLLGVHQVVSLPKEKSYFVTAGERSRFNAGVLPGARIDLGTLEEVPAVQVSKQQIMPGSWYWSEWRLRPQDRVSTALVSRAIHSGHLVWLGFHPELIQPDYDSQHAARALFSSLAEFLLDQATVELAPWPSPYQSAALLAMDTEDRFGNAEDVYQLSQKANVPLTYFILGKDAETFPELVSKLSTGGEIASHSYLHDSYEESPRDVQESRLKKVRAHLTEMGYANSIGFRPPYEAYNNHTIPALVKNGFKYMAGDTELASMAIRTVTLSDTSKFYLIPRSFIDDYELFENLEAKSEKEIMALVQPEIDLAHHNHGLYYFSFHTQMIAIPKHLKVLEKIMQEVSRDDVWTATGQDIVEWWQLRSNIKVETNYQHDMVSIDVVNIGDKQIPPFRLFIHTLPKTSLKIKENSSTVELKKFSERTELQFGELQPNSRVQVSLDIVTP